MDERDSYLESIIELQQDKDFLNYQLSSNGGGGGGLNGAGPGAGGLNPGSTNNISSASLLIAAAKHISANGFASGANSCCLDTNTNTTSSSSTSPNAVKSNSNTFDLKAYISEVLVELIQNMSNQQQQQQLSSGAKVSATAQSGKDSSSASNSYLNGSLIDLSDTQNLINILESVHKEIAASKSSSSEGLAKNGSELDQDLCCDEFKVKKLMSSTNSYSNWSQKIAVELVECKIRFRQLVNDM